MASFVFRGFRGWRRRRIDKRHQQHFDTEIDREVVEAVEKSDAVEVKINGHANGHVKGEKSEDPARKPSSAASPSPNPTPAWQLSIASLGKLGLIMAYFFLCDRLIFYQQ